MCQRAEIFTLGIKHSNKISFIFFNEEFGKIAILFNFQAEEQLNSPFRQYNHAESGLKTNRSTVLVFSSNNKNNKYYLNLHNGPIKKQATNYSYPGKKHIQPDLTGLLKVSEAEI